MPKPLSLADVGAEAGGGGQTRLFPPLPFSPSGVRSPDRQRIFDRFDS